MNTSYEIASGLVRQLAGYFWACQDLGLNYIDSLDKAKAMYISFEFPDEIWSALCIGAISAYEEMNSLPETYSEDVIKKAALSLSKYISEHS